MIGSFWNLCRACPSMPIDKLHSEYRSTYRWHEYTGPRQEVVRRPPQTNIPEKTINDISASRNHDDDFQSDSLTKQEPAMPRRKKYPDLAYRHHEFISTGREGREPEWRPSRRSKSEGPARGVGVPRGGGAQRGDGQGDGERRRESDPDVENANTGHTSRRDAAGSTPRKSHSMGALKARAQANAMVHKNRIDMENRDASELEPLVGSQEKPKQESNSEYRKKFRPFSQYEYSGGVFNTKENPKPPMDEADNNVIVDNEDGSWYKEVVELRKKAGEYKHRGWGSDLTPDRVHDIYNKQIELWDQVSRRSSLSALSLASLTHKAYTKEEKEDDNNRKSSPTKAHRNAENSARMIKDIIKHHLEKTTGGSEYEGLIWSPTRDKLEPTIPRKDDDSRGSQKGSPKKSSPMKSSSLKRTNKAKQVRSQSVGPTPDTNVEKRSPKRQSRSTTAKEGRKSSNETPSNKRPRPSDQAADNTSSVTKDIATYEEHDSITYEPLIKSPPEPTRVKSPEQIIMRSPDPVNWTVPLDTGKTFTVTQNVREGDMGIRPHSEVKAWTPPAEVPPPVAQSAPPTLTEETKAHVAFS